MKPNEQVLRILHSIRKKYNLPADISLFLSACFPTFNKEGKIEISKLRTKNILKPGKLG